MSRISISVEEAKTIHQTIKAAKKIGNMRAELKQELLDFLTQPDGYFVQRVSQMQMQLDAQRNEIEHLKMSLKHQPELKNSWPLPAPKVDEQIIEVLKVIAERNNA